MSAFETSPSLADLLQIAIDRSIEGVNVAIPARVESYNALKQSINAQPLIRRGYTDENGDRQVETLPIVTNVPVAFPGAGGFRLTMPVTKGDTVLLIFSQRSLDKWLTKGGLVDPNDDRTHDMSDAVAILGVRSFANPLVDAPTSHASLGKDGGTQIQCKDASIDIGNDGDTFTGVDGVVVGSGVDPFTGSTYFVLGNTTSKLRSK